MMSKIEVVLCRAAVIVLHICFIVNGYQSSKAPLRKTFLQMGPLNAIKNMVYVYFDIINVDICLFKNIMFVHYLQTIIVYVLRLLLYQFIKNNFLIFIIIFSVI